MVMGAAAGCKFLTMKQKPYRVSKRKRIRLHDTSPHSIRSLEIAELGDETDQTLVFPSRD